MTRELYAAGRAAHKAVAASQQRDHAIRTAHQAGNTIRAIATVCGLSAARVHQILHKTYARGTQATPKKDHTATS